MKTYLTILLALAIGYCKAQEKNTQQQTLSESAIGSDGKYIFYITKVKGNNFGKLHIKKFSGQQISVVDSVTTAAFTDNGDFLHYVKANQSGFIFHLSSNRIKLLPQVTSIASFNQKDRVFFFIKKTNQDGLLYSEDFAEVWRAANILNFVAHPTGNFGIVTFIEKEKPTTYKLDINSKKLLFVANDIQPDKFIWNNQQTRGAFYQKDGKMISIYEYDCKGNDVTKICGPGMYGFPGNQVILNSIFNYRYSKDDSYLFFNTKENRVAEKSPAKVIIRSYRDTLVRLPNSTNEPLREVDVTYRAACELKSKKFIALNGRFERFSGLASDSIVLIERNVSRIMDFGRPKKFDYKIKNIRTGEVKNIKFDSHYVFSSQIAISPDAKNLVFFDNIKCSIFIYDINSQTSREVKVEEGWGRNYELENKPGGYMLFDPIFSPDNQFVVLHARQNFWRIDLKRNTPPVNLTQSSELTSATIYSKTKLDYSIHKGLAQLPILGINTLNKEFSFDILYDVFGKHSQKRMYSGSYYVNGMIADYTNLEPRFIKKSDNDCYLIHMEEAASPMNVYGIKKGQGLKKLSEIKSVQGRIGKKELVSAKGYNDVLFQGILHKPAGFDSTKKYPVIVSIYESISSTLHQYPDFGLSGGGINPTHFTAKGYLVLEPDMKRIIGSFGRATTHSIDAAWQMLRKLPYVDTNKVGIAGASFGGYEVEYIIGQTDRYKAAMSMCGNFDFTVRAASVRDGETYFYNVANDQAQLGKTFLEDPDLYRLESPSTYVKNIKTPVLLVHNDKDGAVPINQSQFMFIQLRELNHPVWWIDYPEEGHGIRDEENARDYQQRLEDFFGYYLRGEKMPVWMDK